MKLRKAALLIWLKSTFIIIDILLEQPKYLGCNFIAPLSLLHFIINWFFSIFMPPPLLWHIVDAYCLIFQNNLSLVSSYPSSNSSLKFNPSILAWVVECAFMARVIVPETHILIYVEKCNNFCWRIHPQVKVYLYSRSKSIKSCCIFLYLSTCLWIVLRFVISVRIRTLWH